MVGEDGMDIDRTKLVNQIITDFEASYVYFLIEKHFHDSSVVRAAFYAACEKMVNKGEPHPDSMVQSAVLEHLKIRKNDAMKDYLESIERIFDEVSSAGRRRV